MRRILVLAAVGLACLGGSASGTSRQLRVALVADVVLSDPHDFRNIAYQGFRRAVKAFGVKGRLVLYNPKEGPIPTIRSLAQQKYDLIIADPGFDDKAYVAVAASFPTSRFAMPGVPYQALGRKLENVQGTIWRVEQPSYLAGYLAALLEKRRPGRDVVGSVNGFDYANGDFVAAYEAGARKADPGIRTLRGLSREWLDPVKCRAVALNQIAKGAGVLFNLAGACGLGTLQAAKEKGAWGIGVDVDQSYLGPHILTSVLKRYDLDAYENVKALVKGRLKTGSNVYRTLGNGGVDLSRISPKVPRAFVRRLEGIRRQIITGKIKPPNPLPWR
jgi:basic membrane protein A and related proteins